MVIFGVDPGYATVGFGVIEAAYGRIKYVAHGTIETPKTERLPARLKIIGDQISELISLYKPGAVAIEELFFEANRKTAITVAEARGVILYAAEKTGVKLYEYTPLQIKQALTGYGRAEKNQIQQMVKVFLGLKEIPRPDDAADALAVAVTHAQTSPALSKTQI
jgi:crossover junction endodeoxyribonuclease RuvC